MQCPVGRFRLTAGENARPSGERRRTVTSSRLPSAAGEPRRSRICAAVRPLSGTVAASIRSSPSGTTATSAAGTTISSA